MKITNLKICLVFLLIMKLGRLVAGEGLVIVERAPLFSGPSWDQLILQYKYQGEKVYLHDKYFTEEFLESPSQEFLVTQSLHGKKAYIPTKYVKLIYEDQREAFQAIRVDPDPTSLELEEIGKHPLYSKKMSFTIGQGTPSGYKYNNDATLSETSLGFSTSLHGMFLQRIGKAHLAKYFFGLLGHIRTSAHESTFTSGLASNERIWELGLGPLMAINLIEREYYDLLFGGGFSFDFRSISVNNSLATLSESRTFNGLTVSPLISLQWHGHKLIPDYDLVVGSKLYLNLAQDLTSSQAIENPTIWNQNDQDMVQTSMTPQLDIFIGIQTNF